MKKIALLSNITINMIEKELRQNYLIYIPNGYDTWISEIFNKTSSLFSFLPEAIVVLLDGTEFNGYVDINKVKEKLLLYQNALNNLIHSFENIPIFISTIDFRESKIKSYYERKTYFSLSEYWYDSIQKIVEENKNVSVLDIFDKIIEIGRTNFYSNKMWYLGNMPYSKIGIYTVVNEINNALSSAFSSRKKIIVLDLDNTLWGGVIGEDGLDGIELSRHKEGARYYDFQMCFQEMKKRGVLLAISSKNNLNDVEEVFEKHPDIALKKDDFVSMKINWNNKADNIKSIEAELNLTEGSFSFSFKR